MKEFRERATGKVFSENELRLKFPEKTLPNNLTLQILDGIGFDPVLPAPAPAVTSEQYAVRNGVVADTNGNWVFAWKIETYPTATVTALLAEVIANGIKAIDMDADKIYGDVIGNRGEEYRTAEAHASAYIAAGYTGDVPSSVSSWATAKGQTAQWAADDIMAQATAWRTAQAAIRSARLARKEQLRTATSIDQATAAINAWNTFVAYIRGQLGV